jgi:hypothetical protein
MPDLRFNTKNGKCSPPKRLWSFVTLQDYMSQKTEVFIVTAVITSDLTLVLCAEQAATGDHRERCASSPQTTVQFL